MHTLKWAASKHAETHTNTRAANDGLDTFGAEARYWLEGKCGADGSNCTKLGMDFKRYATLGTNVFDEGADPSLGTPSQWFSGYVHKSGSSTTDKEKRSLSQCKALAPETGLLTTTGSSSSPTLEEVDTNSPHALQHDKLCVTDDKSAFSSTRSARLGLLEPEVHLLSGETWSGTVFESESVDSLLMHNLGSSRQLGSADVRTRHPSSRPERNERRGGGVRTVPCPTCPGRFWPQVYSGNLVAVSGTALTELQSYAGVPRDYSSDATRLNEEGDPLIFGVRQKPDGFRHDLNTSQLVVGLGNAHYDPECFFCVATTRTCCQVLSPFLPFFFFFSLLLPDCVVECFLCLCLLPALGVCVLRLNLTPGVGGALLLLFGCWCWRWWCGGAGAVGLEEQADRV